MNKPGLAKSSKRAALGIAVVIGSLWMLAGCDPSGGGGGKKPEPPPGATYGPPPSGNSGPGGPRSNGPG